MLTQFLTGILTIGAIPDVMPHSVRTKFPELFGTPSTEWLHG
jgi:hypothetical protein